MRRWLICPDTHQSRGPAGRLHGSGVPGHRRFFARSFSAYVSAQNLSQKHKMEKFNTTMYENETSSGAASDAPRAVTLDAQTIGKSINNFCADTASVACLAQELAVRFAVMSSQLRPGDVIDADHLMARLSAAVVQAGQILSAALNLTLLCVMTDKRGGTIN
jgi:hypothetical protein